MGAACSCGGSDADGNGLSDEQRAAVAKLVEEIAGGTAKVPSFTWQFRDGFNNVVLGTEGISRVAAELRQGTHSVEVLELQKHMMRDAGAEQLGTGLAASPRLRVVNVSKNGLGDAGACAVVDGVVAGCPCIKRLLMHSNDDIGLAGFAHVCAAVRDVGLEELELSCGGSGCIDADTDSSATLTDAALSIATHQSLHTLVVQWPQTPGSRHTGLGAGALGTFIEGLGAHESKLRSLKLVGPPPVGTVWLPAQSALAAGVLTRQLHHLSLRNVRCNATVCRAIAQGLESRLCCLRELALCACLDDEGDVCVSALAVGLGRNRSLTVLDVSHNPSVSTESWLRCINAFETQPALKTFNMVGIDMHDSMAAALCRVLRVVGAAPLQTVRHGVIDSDQLATTLANLLQENERAARDAQTAFSPTTDDRCGTESPDEVGPGQRLPPETTTMSFRGGTATRDADDTTGDSFSPGTSATRRELIEGAITPAEFVAGSSARQNQEAKLLQLLPAATDDTEGSGRIELEMDDDV